MQRLAAATLGTIACASASAQTIRVDLLAPAAVEPGEAFEVVVRGDFTEAGLTDAARLAVFASFFETTNAEIVGLRLVEPFATTSPTFEIDFNELLGLPAVVLEADEIILTETGLEVGFPLPEGEADLFVLEVVAGEEGEASVGFVTDAAPAVDGGLGAGVFVFVVLPGFDLLFAGFEPGDDATAVVGVGDEPTPDITIAGTLSVSVPVAFPACGGADLASPFGSLDGADAMAFLALADAGAADADLDGSGAFDLFDLLAYLGAFDQGCG